MPSRGGPSRAFAASSARLRFHAMLLGSCSAGRLPGAGSQSIVMMVFLPAGVLLLLLAGCAGTGGSSPVRSTRLLVTLVVVWVPKCLLMLQQPCCGAQFVPTRAGAREGGRKQGFTAGFATQEGGRSIVSEVSFR